MQWLGNHHPWKGSKAVWMWHLGMWFRGEHGDAGLAVRLDGLRGLFEP